MTRKHLVTAESVLAAIDSIIRARNQQATDAPMYITAWAHRFETRDPDLNEMEEILERASAFTKTRWSFSTKPTEEKPR